MTFVPVLLIGLCVGILTGMFGVGGGFLITPLLNVLLGIPMPVAVGTGALQILSVSTAGIYRRRHESMTDYKLAIVLFGGNYMGVQFGAQALARLQSLGIVTFGENSMPAADFYVLCIFLVLLGLIAGWLIYDTTRNQLEPSIRVGLFSRIKLPPFTRFESLDRPTMSIPVVAYFGLALGFLAGLLGIGGGVIMLPALVYLVGMKTHRATATSLALIWLSSLVASVTHTLRGNTDLLLAIPLLLGGTVGVQIGVALCSKLGGCQLRRYFSLVVLAAMVLVAAKLMTIAL